MNGARTIMADDIPYMMLVSPVSGIPLPCPACGDDLDIHNWFKVTPVTGEVIDCDRADAT